MKNVYPDVILFPLSGVNASMWQEVGYSGKICFPDTFQHQYRWYDGENVRKIPLGDVQMYTGYAVEWY